MTYQSERPFDDERDDEQRPRFDNEFSGGLGPLTGDWDDWIRQTTGLQLAVEPDRSLGGPGWAGPDVHPTDNGELDSITTLPLDGDSPTSAYPPLGDRAWGQRREDAGNLPGEEGGRPTTPQQRPTPPGSGPMRAQQPREDYFSAALRQRRGEDERTSGRHWPSSAGRAGDRIHQAYLDQMSVALGEVEPALFAREMALRYVQASRQRGESQLAPTDIYAILRFGLALNLRPLDCTGLPHVLAVYHRATREIYLDWKLLQEPPIGRAILDATAWRRAVDSSLLARFLLAWCVATHLTESYDVPLVLGFAPRLLPATHGRGAYGPTIGAPAPLSADTLNRYRKALEATATLLAPAERLWQQIATQVRVPIGDPNWRQRLRERYGYRAADPRAGQFGPGDPVESLLAELAERNRCPRALIEAQLDGTAAKLDWHEFTAQLVREIPALQMRHTASTHMFNAGKIGPNWSPRAPGLDDQTIVVELSL